MAIDVLSNAYQALMCATTVDELRALIEKFCKEMGFDNFGYAISVTAPSLKSQHFIISNYSKEWLTRYVAKDYFRIDPVIRHTQASTLPLLWDDRTLQDESAEEFWAEAANFGLRSGLTFSVHEQPGVTGTFSLARDKVIDVAGHDLAALIGRAQMFASLLHLAVCRIELPKLLPESNTTLTQRERECLKWSADGKTAWEIGQILSITERTTVFHVNNAMQKLGATSKIQAIVRALTLKLI